MKEVYELVKQIIKIDLIILAILMAGSFVYADNPIAWIKGYTFGGLIGILNFLLLANTVKKASTMYPSQAQIYGSCNYFMRMAVTAVVVIIALKADYLNAISVIIGLLLIKQVIYFSQIFNDKEYFRKIVRRKEE